jgi:glycosyltransferase involved in cell wall biosynthesis
VAADAAVLVDPYDEGALRQGLARLLASEDLRSDLRRRGLKRAGQFSWERTAQETLAIYEAVARR